MDINLPGMSGIEAVRRMLAREPGAKVLVFSMHDDALFGSCALQAGARGYVTKASAPDVLVEAVTTVARELLYDGNGKISQPWTGAGHCPGTAIGPTLRREAGLTVEAS